MANGRSCCCAGLTKGWWWLLTLLGLPFLYYLMLSAKWEPIEKNIQSRTTEQLNDNGLDWSSVEIERRGRDVLLTGTATTDAKRDDAIRIAQGVEGVRSVDSDITIVLLKERALLASYDHNSESKLVLEGVVSSQDKVDELSKILADALGSDKIDNKLTVSDQYADEGGTLVLSGLALSDDTVSNISSAVIAGSSALGLKFTNNLAIDKSALKKIADEKAEADKLVAEKAEADKLAAEKAEADKLAMEKAEADKLATEKAEVSACQTKLNNVMRDKTILFETNKANIKNSSFSLLKTIATVITECRSKLPDARIAINGHTDSKGSDTYNLALSERRANSVKTHLIGIGVSAAIITSKGYGESQPVSSNDTAEGRSKNRRIAFSVQ